MPSEEKVSREHAPACPHCGRADQVTLVSAFGGQIITAQWHCGACRTYFEAVRGDFEEI